MAQPTASPPCRRSTLNQKVFKKLGFQLQKEEMDGLCNCQTQAVERLLKTLQMKMAKCARAHTARGCGDGASQHVPTPPSPLPPRYGAKRAATSDAQSDQGSQHSKVTPRSVAAPTRRSAAGGPSPAAATDGAVRELLAEKDLNINELRETVDILEIKIQKLEQLVRLKDSKIATLQAKLQQQPM